MAASDGYPLTVGVPRARNGRGFRPRRTDLLYLYGKLSLAEDPRELVDFRWLLPDANGGELS